MSLKVQGIEKVFKTKAVLKQVTFSVHPGQIVGIVGPNGAGKSTLLRIVTGMIQANAGNVEFMGQPLHKSQSYLWGYLPEERGLYPHMTVLQQCQYFAALKGKHLSNESIELLLQAWNMQEYTHQKMEALSKGNQQKIQFLISVLHHPELIILDEPFSGLDPIQVEWLKAKIIALKKEGKMVIYASHRMDSVEALCDQVLVLNAGKVLKFDSPENLCRSTNQGWELQTTRVIPLAQWKAMHLEVQAQEEQTHRVQVLSSLSLVDMVASLQQHGVELQSIQPLKVSLQKTVVQLIQADYDA
jgi:ABC-2 type transport system ATP-binding protein